MNYSIITSCFQHIPGNDYEGHLDNIQGTQKCGKLNKTFKQGLALLLVMSFAIPPNVYANNNSPDGANTELSQDRLNFSQVDVEAQSINTTGTLEGMKVDIDLIRGELKGNDSDKLVRVLRQLEPQLRKAYELDPNTKFKFLYVTDDGSKNVSIEAQEVFDFLSGITNKSESTTVRVKAGVAERLRELYYNIFSAGQKVFSRTSKSDVMWSVARFVTSGTSATYSFTVSDIPLPASIAIGYGVLGLGSGGIGLFIEHFTTWLDNNHIDPSKKRSMVSRLGSVETYMFLSPLLIGLQQTGVATTEGAMLLAGTATAGAIVQNVYYQIKKRSPQAAMWYKWYATEALFITAPNLIFPKYDVYVNNVADAIGSTFLFALYSTASQGVWDVFLTNIRRPSLEAAIKRDLVEFSERFDGKNIFEMSANQIKQLAQKEEFKVREKFKPYYFAASFVSVTFAIAGTTGRNMQIAALETAGIAGLATLGVSGMITWGYVKFKNRTRAPKVQTSTTNTFSGKRRLEVTNPKTMRELLDSKMNQARAGMTCAHLFKFAE